MARDVLITPASGLIDFLDTSVSKATLTLGTNGILVLTGGSNPIVIETSTSGSSALRVDGTNGTLFEVVDDLSGSLMSVNDAAGLPVLEVFADSHIVAGRYGQNDFYLDTNGNLGLGNSSPSYKLDVSGGLRIYQDTTSAGSGVGLTVENDGTGDAIVQYLLTQNIRWVTGIDNSDGDKFKIASSADLNSDAHLTIQADGNVGIGTNSPERNLHVFKGESNGAAANSDSTLVLENSSHTYVQFLTPTTSESGLLFGDSDNDRGALTYNHNTDSMNFRIAANTRMFINSSGSVGMGTTSPATQLDVSGATTLRGEVRVAHVSSNGILQLTGGDTSAGVNNRTQIAFGYSGAATYEHYLVTRHNAGGGSGNAIDFYVSDGNSSGTYPTNAVHNLTLDGGNVGIGTTSPGYLLDLQSTATGLTHNLKLNKSSTTGDYAEIAFQLWSGAGTGLNTFGGSGTSRPSVVLRAINEASNSAAGAFVVGTFTGGATNSTLTEKFRITSAGSVGIGTSSPGAPLHVYQAAKTAIPLRLHNYTSDISNDGTTTNFIDFYSTDGNATFTPQVRIGSVIQDQAGDGGIASEGHGNFVVYTGMGTDASGNGTLTEWFRVNHDGNVGIGTTSPSQKLQVNGGHIYIGTSTNKFLVSNGYSYFTDYSTYGGHLGRISSISMNNGSSAWDVYANHGISSTDSNGNFADSISINSYNDITLRLDTNSNDSASYLRIMNNTTGNSAIAYIGFDGTYSTAQLPSLVGVNAGPSTSWNLYVAGNGYFTSGVVVPETTNGGFEYRTNSSWGGWSRNAFTIADGSGSNLVSYGGYGGSGTTLSYGYLGKSYIDYSIAFQPDGITYITYDGSTKFNTESWGVRVTGSLVSGNGTFQGSSGDGVVKIYGSASAYDGVLELLNESGGNAEGFRIRYDNNVGDTYLDNIWAGGSDANPAIRFRTKTYSATVDAMTISHGGNVGIGTTGPTSKLDIRNTSCSTASLFVQNSGGYGSSIGSGALLAKFCGDSDSLEIRNLSQGDYSILNPQQNNGIVFYDGSGGVKIIYNGACKLNVDSNGITTCCGIFNCCKYTGVGDICSCSDIVAGIGGGGVALTINDGYGNANVTFNHKCGVPEQAGNSGRIEVNTDSCGSAYMAFELASNVTCGSAVQTGSILTLCSSSIIMHQTTCVCNTLRVGGNIVWHAGNDGCGSGLDADLLDGQHGSYYLNYCNFSNTPTIPTNNNQLTNGCGYITSYTNYYLNGISKSGNMLIFSVNGTTDQCYTFGSNAFNSTTIPTNNNQLINGAGYTTNIGDITGVTAGTGLSGGGTSGSVTLNLANTSVTAGSYTNSNITVDAQGRITSASSGSGGCTPSDAQITFNYGACICGYVNPDAFTLNQSSNESFCFAHRTGGAGSGTYSGGVNSITLDSYGHVTSVSTGCSDYRVKTNVQPYTIGYEAIKQVGTYQYVLINDENKKCHAGMMAHELQEAGIFHGPYGIKDEVNEKGEPIYQTVNYSELVPTLWSALRKSIDKIERLENKVAELENRVNILGQCVTE